MATARHAAAVTPGTWFLAVRERHAEETGPVEKPSDPYRLTVRLAEPEPGVEVEPNDEPEDAAARFRRYPEWRALAQRNRLGEGRLRGDLGPGDADVLALGPAGPGEAPAWLLVVPEAELAVAAEAWRPDAGDRDPPASQDRVRFEPRASLGDLPLQNFQCCGIRLFQCVLFFKQPRVAQRRRARRHAALNPGARPVSGGGGRPGSSGSPRPRAWRGSRGASPR